MINTLKYDVQIVTPLRTYDFKREFKFERGMTGIIGKNESGKSVSLEMIRYALFGTAALRGPVTDYKKLDVELSFKVRDTDYIVRRGKQTSLQTIDGIVATGTKPVNAKIIETLGYDLKVFDVANSCCQGKVEALGDMLPAERKKMVDQTIGLNVLDQITKYFGDEALIIKRQCDAIEPLIVEPTAPVKPENYRESKSLHTDLNALQVLERERVGIEGWLSNPVAAPVKPADFPLQDFDGTDLVKYQADRQEIVNKLNVLKMARSQLETTEATQEQLDALQKQLDDWNLWQQKERLLDRGENECPSCHHKWPLAADELKEYEHVCEVERPQFTLHQINQYRILIANTARAKRLDEDIKQVQVELAATPDRGNELEARRQYQAALFQHEKNMLVYKGQLLAHEEYLTQVEAKQAKLKELEGVPAKISAINAILPACISFEAQMQSFDTQYAAYQKNLADLNEKKAKYEDLTKAKAALVALKAKVKTYLVPSLNRVASILLNQMTGGERSSVQIDEEFNILIDGQPINTLSGSGKAVANLAVRIGLGQVLTNKVFSLFMADEVDAAMDEDRAAYTAQCLRRLTETISQVVLVTHKRPATDHLFELTR